MICLTVRIYPDTSCKRLNTLIAAQAAPKPLSIFVTTSPDVQLAKMEFKATSPFFATPYPTEVGTQIMGFFTNQSVKQLGSNL